VFSREPFLLDETGKQAHLRGIADGLLPLFPDGVEGLVAVVGRFFEEV